MNSRGLPTTSYGYTPPPDARVDGWRCFADECHAGGSPAPRRWPASCPECGSPVDPTFESPWDHDAEGVLLAHQARSAARVEQRAIAGASLYSWEYKDAVLKQDPARQERARVRFHDVLGRLSSRQDAWAFRTALTATVWDAVAAVDLDFAADLILAWRLSLRTDDVENDNQSRAEGRSFVSLCIRFLEHEESVGHTREREVHNAMQAVAKVAWTVLHPSHMEGFDRIKHLRAKVSEVARIGQRDRTRINTIALHAPLPHPSSKDWAIAGRPPAAVRQQLDRFATVIAHAWSGRSEKGLTAAFDGLTTTVTRHSDEPTALWAAILLTDAALLLSDAHDDATRLFTTADLLSSVRGSPRARTVSAGLEHLLRAHGHIALMHDRAGEREQHAQAAVSELALGEDIARRTALPLFPAVRAVQGLLLLQRAQDQGTGDAYTAISRGISTCLAGRTAVVRPWQKTSGADIALARLLVWRAFLVDEHPAERFADTREAVRLMKRWRRPGQTGPTIAQVILNEALQAQDVLAGGPGPGQRARSWRNAAAKAVYAPTAMRMRLAVSWVAWAVENDDPALACEAYENLVSLIPLDAAARYRPDARKKVLSAAQEHTEEAGYWLARAGRYREAVVALETGRAISLSYLASWDNADIVTRLEHAGRSALVVEFRAALAALSAEERVGAGAEGPDSPLQRAWTHVHAVADEIAEATGQHPLIPNVDYADITGVNDDGAVIYVAAAKAGGYALVVAGGHDPQYVHLPEVTRDAVMDQLESMLAGQEDQVLGLFRLAGGLRWLAKSGLRDILLFHARGRVVTLVPVGLLSLLPLHAASDEQGNYIGDFSAIRYTPNIRTLLRCRETVRAMDDRPLRLLAVNVPEGHGQPATKYLRHVTRETAEISRIWRISRRDDRIVDDCTWEEFKSVADDYSVWHIACHGAAAPLWSQESVVHFADSAVTLEQVATELRAGPRRLAVLSACQSHLTGAELPNEVVGLPTALLQLGFGGVIATAWRIDDVATTYLMTRFYHFWTTEGLPPAVALNKAQQSLRTASRDDLAQLIPDVPAASGDTAHPYAHPYYWAAFAYTGA